MSATLRWCIEAVVVFASVASARGNSVQFEGPTFPESSLYLGARLVQLGNGVSLNSLHSPLLADQKDQSQPPIVFYGVSYGINLWFERPVRPATITQPLLELLIGCRGGVRVACWEKTPLGAKEVLDHDRVRNARPNP